jgi:hypothetical protein
MKTGEHEKIKHKRKGRINDSEGAKGCQWREGKEEKIEKKTWGCGEKWRKKTKRGEI